MISWRTIDLAVKGLAVFVALIMPYVIGVNHFSLAIDSHCPLFNAVFFGGLGCFFSLGLLLSVTKIGQRYKYTTLLLLIISYPVHFVYFLTAYSVQMVLLVVYIANGIAMFKRGQK